MLFAKEKVAKKVAQRRDPAVVRCLVEGDVCGRVRLVAGKIGREHGGRMLTYLISQGIVNGVPLRCPAESVQQIM